MDSKGLIFHEVNLPTTKCNSFLLGCPTVKRGLTKLSPIIVNYLTNAMENVRLVGNCFTTAEKYKIKMSILI